MSKFVRKELYPRSTMHHTQCSLSYTHQATSLMFCSYMFAVMCVRFFGDDSVAECIQQKTKSVIKTSEGKKLFPLSFSFSSFYLNLFLCFLVRIFIHSVMLSNKSYTQNTYTYTHLQQKPRLSQGMIHKIIATVKASKQHRNENNNNNSTFGRSV